jgi:hypothetical protein
MTLRTNYLLGDPTDAANWGDPTWTKGGQWAPLELVVAPRFRGNFMFMGVVTANVGDDQVAVSLYKHDMSREYVNVDENGTIYEWVGRDNWYRALESFDEARSRLVGVLVEAIEGGIEISP